MARPFDIYTEDIYSIFKEIEESAYHDIIRFYESNETNLDHLEVDESLDITFSYATALFEVGRYDDFIRMSKDMLESIIYLNIKYFRGEDIFEVILFKKAAAHYQILQLQQAETLLWELLRINPHNNAAAYLLRKCRMKNEPTFLKVARSSSIILFLIAASLISIELLIIKPFFEDYSENMEVIRTTIFLLGIGVLFVADGSHRVWSYHTINRSVEALKRDRTS